MKLLIITLVLIGNSCYTACAQTAPLISSANLDQLKVTQAQLPPGPALFSRAPELSSWQVIYHYDDDKGGESNAASPAPGGGAAPGKPPRIQMEAVQKTKSVMHRVITMNHGSGPEYWMAYGLEMIKEPGGGPPVVFVGAALDPYYIDTARTDFPGWEWVDPSKFAGEAQVGDAKFFVFQETASPKEIGEPHLENVGKAIPGVVYSESKHTVLALVSEVTHLPVLMRLSDHTLVYNFGASPTSMLTLPTDYISILEKITGSKNLPSPYQPISGR